MRSAWLSVGAVWVMVLASGGCSSRSVEQSDGEKVGSASQEIQNGEIDSTHTFALGLRSGGGGLCSGALILPNVVATARHCVSESPNLIECSKNPTFGALKNGGFAVTTNTSMSGGSGSSGWYRVKSVALPDDDHICGNDIALLVLTSSIPSDVATPIVPGVQYQMWDPDQYEPSFTAIGYGSTSPAGKGSGTRRIKHKISVLCVPGSYTMPCPKGIVSDKEFVAGDGTCSGDSGSGAFETGSMERGAPVSFGVLSRGGESDDKTECLASVYTRFDAHRDFVLKVAKEASNDWELYPEPSWTEYKPPPPPPPPKDAGAPKDGGSKKKPSLLEDGEVCESSAECESGVCADAGDGTSICASACDDTNGTSCPDGYECRENLCLPPVEPATGPGVTIRKTTVTGCSASPGEGFGGTWGMVALGGALAVAAGRRRRKSG